MRVRRPRITNRILKAKLEDWHYLTSGLIIKLQYLKQCDIGEVIDKSMKQNRDPRNSYSLQTFVKGRKAIQWSKEGLFHKWFWKDHRQKKKKRIWRNLKCIFRSEICHSEKWYILYDANIWYSGKGDTMETVKSSAMAMGYGGRGKVHRQGTEDS